MRLWAEMFDAFGNRLGDGPVTSVMSVSVRRVLDGVGRITIEVPGTDQRAVDLMTNEARVRVYVIEGNTNSDYAKRLIASGIIRQRTASESSSGWTLSLTGPDDLDEMKRVSTMLGLTYNTTTNAIITDLVSEVSGWSVSVSETGNHYARFDGVNILQAIGAICKEKGIHFRSGTSAQTIEVGSFGVSNGLTLVQPSRHNTDLYANDNVAILESVRIEEDTENVVNRIVPLGAGAGETRLTLINSTRSTPSYPYNVTNTARHGKQLYYVEDTTSQAIYGVIEKVLLFDQIQIQSNSWADTVTASNALYDVAVAHLQRHKTAQFSYSVEIRKAHMTIRPGDKVHMVYKGFIERTMPDGTVELMPPVDINDYFWVMEVTETVNLQGTKVSMTLSNIDRHMLDAARIVVGELEKIQIRDLTVKAFTSHWGFNYKKEIDSTHTATIPLEVTSRTLQFRQVLLRLQSTPFRATATGAASGGGSTQTSTSNTHKHLILRSNDGTALAAGLTSVRFTMVEQSTGTLYHFDAQSDAGAGTRFFDMQASGNHSHDVTIPAHTHAQAYGIYDDTSYPAGITITIDGVSRTVALGGPWGTIGAGINVVLDLTAYFPQYSGSFQSLHTIVIGCASGQGIVQGILEIYEDIQNLG